ncbi:MAG: Bax inhibitor-1/YccA family protein [Gammaproteobacteria bacterium]|nr:Bax inhibitor-1/YccA family protein [Gammaproteobacteria bacterium]
MSHFQRAVAPAAASALEINKVLRNTYTLLAVTLLFSAMMAGVSMYLQVGGFVPMACSIGAIVIIWFVLPRFANSAAGLGIVFLITGLLGFGVGPLINAYMGLANGGSIVMTALGGTAAIFLALSGYALTTKRDFSWMGGMLVAGFVVVLIAALANIFFQMPALSLTISAVVIMIMSGFILYDTSRIIHGGETNYIMATVGMYLSIYNIFVSLLSLLGAFSSDD